MECAGRALSFWSYQVSQDLYVLGPRLRDVSSLLTSTTLSSIWEAHRCRALTARCHEMSKEVDRVVNDANSHLVDAQNKIQSKSPSHPFVPWPIPPAVCRQYLPDMAAEQDELRKRNEELSQAYKEKNRKLLSTQELYDKLKRRLMLGQIQEAASEAVDATIAGGRGPMNFGNGRLESQGQFEQQFNTPLVGPAPLVGPRYNDRLDQPAGMPANPRMGPPDMSHSAWARPPYPQGSYTSFSCWYTTI